MSTRMHTKKSQGAGDLTLEELYNMLMYDIEPELMTDMIGKLDEVYRDETEEKRVMRVERYERAFEECEQRLSLFLHLWEGFLRHEKEKLLSSAKKKSARRERSQLENIERSIEEQ